MRKLSAELETLQHKSSILEKKLHSLHHTLAQLEKTQRRAETILSHIHEGLLFIDFQGTIRECNRAACLFLDLEYEKLLSQSFWEYFEDTLFGFSMKDMLEKKCEKKHLIISLSQGKRNLQLEVNTTFIPSEGLILILRDRSEINTLERTIRENERLHALGEMAATLAHEIRNPLGGITGFASLLLKEPEITASQERMVRAILEGTHLLNTLVTSVLEYARPCIINLAPVNLKSCLEEMLLYLSIEERSRITIKCPETLMIVADTLHFKRALLNLVQNGLEASPKEKGVEVLAKKGKDVITIKDQGSGIPDELLNKVMTPFFTTKTKGTGLGLSEANKIIKAHGFTLTISSKKSGTQVFIGGIE
jgi:signal transduction histidine kinase